MTFNLHFIASLKSFLETEVGNCANTIDNDPDALFGALRGLGNLDLLALQVPQRWGGKEVDEVTYGEFQELIARYSGALAFLQTQHQSAARMLAASENADLQAKYLPRMGRGEVLLGVGFSQLRREGKPLVIAQPRTSGFLLDGVVPWVTGWGIFEGFIVAATLPDGSAVFGMVPLQSEEKRQTDVNINISPVAELAAMPSTNTVAVELKSWFLSDEDVVFIKPPGWIHQQDKNSVLKSTFLATGCALASLDIIEQTAHKKNLPFITNALTSLQQELENCRIRIREAIVNSSISYAQKLNLRAWSIDLATRIAHAAVTVSSGAANYKHHNAQRVYREALVFTVTGQTRDVMAATLDNLIRANTISISQSSIKHKNISYSRVIHLSHVIDTSIPQWQNDPPIEFTTVAEIEKQGYYLRRFAMGEHSATHINAPISFHRDGIGIDQYEANSLVLPAVVIDGRKQIQINSDYTLTIADITAWEQKYGEITHQSLVLLHTGWDKKWSNNDAFMPKDKEGNMHFPGFSREATEFLLKERQIAGVGIDTHGIDAGIDVNFSVNRLILEQPRIVLENLTNLNQLPPKGTTLVIAPLLLRDGSGSPVGVMAFIS